MKKYIFVLSLFFFLTLSLAFSPMSKTAFAGAQFFDPVNTCTGINCTNATYRGTFEVLIGGQQPFVAQIFAMPSECVRIEVTEQQTNLEMVLISPSGTIWRDDDSGQGFEPLIKAATAGGPDGWYTLQVSHFGGNAPFGSYDFTLRYGRYNSGNPNCAGPTTPQAAFQAEAAKPEGSFNTMPGGPGAE